MRRGPEQYLDDELSIDDLITAIEAAKLLDQTLHIVKKGEVSDEQMTVYNTAQDVTRIRRAAMEKKVRGS